MPHSLTHLLIHCVYHKGRYAPIIREEDQYRLNGFIIEQSKHLKSHCLIANGPGDHIHLLVALSANISLSQFIKEIKRTSTGFLKECQPGYYHSFHWQEGYAAFSVSYRLKDHVYAYILKQKEHHQKNPMREELELLLRNAHITSSSEKYYWK